jgi:hypothetical protein
MVRLSFSYVLLCGGRGASFERWVARESGGLVLVAGGVFMEAWLADPQAGVVRALHPVEQWLLVFFVQLRIARDNQGFCPARSRNCDPAAPLGQRRDRGRAPDSPLSRMKIERCDWSSVARAISSADPFSN